MREKENNIDYIAIDKTYAVDIYIHMHNDSIRSLRLFFYSYTCWIWWCCPVLDIEPVVILDSEPPRLICSNSSDILSAISCDLLWIERKKRKMYELEYITMDHSSIT